MLHLRLLNPFLLRGFDLVAIMAHSNLTSLLAYCWCILWRIPYVYMADTVEERIKAPWCRRLKGALYRRAAFLFVTGRASARFFGERYGVPAEKIMVGCYSFDYAKIREWAREGRRERGAVRQRLGVAEEATLSIMAANFLPFRDHLGLIQRFEQRPSEHLLLIGEGECLPACREYVASRGLGSRIHFMPGMSFEELARILPAGDVYVHAGREPYSTMPLLARLAGLRLGEHGDIPSYEDLESGEPPRELDAPWVAALFATTQWSQRRGQKGEATTKWSQRRGDKREGEDAQWRREREPEGFYTRLRDH
jgi:glycosyltransferase involved in cell wall biosynthesis